MSERKPDRGETEKAHFNAIASRYIRKDRYRASRAARKLRLVQTLKRLDLPPAPDLLEVGCGAGFASEYLSGRFGTYTGIDFSRELVLLARSFHTGESTVFLEADLYDFDPGKKFDVIIMIGVLHHMPDIRAALDKCRELLRSGGWIAVNEPQRSNPLVGWVRKLRAKFDGTYSRDQEELRAGDLRRWFAESGFQDISASGQGFLSTPFAEVLIRPGLIFLPLSLFSCLADRMIEGLAGRRLAPLAWNVIVTGRNPE